MGRRRGWCSAALLGLLTATPAWAQFNKPEEAIRYRQGALFVMSWHMQQLNAMATRRMPYDAALAADAAATLAAVSKLPWAAFEPGTDKAPSKAKPEVWTETARFRALADKSLADIDKLASVARSGNVADLRSALGAAAVSCRTCHDGFRSQ
jgi:cytochrome c556